MSAGGGGGGDEGGGFGHSVFGDAGTAPPELNLTALMDILSNLLFFLLVCFGASVLMAVNASVPVQSEKSDIAATPQAVTVTIKVAPNGYEIGAVGAVQTEEELAALRRVIPLQTGAPDTAGLSAALLGIKEQYPRSDTVILVPEAGVPYSTLIATMDAARETELDLGGQARRLKLFPTVVVSAMVK